MPEYFADKSQSARSTAAQTRQLDCRSHQATDKDVQEDQRLQEYVPGGSGGSVEGWMHRNDDPPFSNAIR